MTRYDVSQQSLVTQVAEDLKSVKEIQPPEWAVFVKTGTHKERPPTQDDWWHIRAASILNKVSVLGPVGTQKLRRKYGGRKNMGYAPEEFRIASGNIIRTILQQLEEAKLVAQVDKEGRKGRVLTPSGHSFLDKAATKVKA
jgi:small subunit ribosomal protein S19e